MIERLSLFVPALMAPVRAGESQHPIQSVDASLLRELLSRTRQRRDASLEQSLSALTGRPSEMDAVALARAMNLPAATAWLFAAPVLLRPDHAGIYLLGSRPLNLSIEDADAYCAELNGWLAQDGMQLYPVSASRWLLSLSEQSEVSWTPLAEAIGKDLRHVWPHGPSAPGWQTRLTEWQMLLNQSPRNLAREQRGLASVHSLWLWGNPLNANAVRPSTVPWFATTTPVLNIEVGDPNRQSSLIGVLAMPATDVAILDDRLVDPFIHGDVAGYAISYEQFTHEILQPVFESLQRAELAEVALYPDDGHVYVISRQKPWQFWRRPALPVTLRSV